METSRLERNISLYPWYQATTSALPWLPVFFLYFNQYLSLDGVIRLGAIYYFAVVVCEIPSGYLSDRFGRKLILTLSAVFLMLSYLAFIAADGFWLLVVGELFLAAGIAFQSGSDTSLLYDTLVELDRENEYAAREAIAQQYSLLALSASCFAGGWLGGIDLMYPYVVAFGAAMVTFYLTLQLTEPGGEQNRSKETFLQQLVLCVSRLQDSVLRWVLLFFILAYVLSHIAYEFYQPYIKLLGAESVTAFLQADSVPAVSGFVIGVSMFSGALGARFSMRLYQWLGLKRLLLGCTVIQSLIIGGMAMLLHPLILIMVMVRSFPMAVTHGPMLGAIGPRVDSRQRASYLSIQSLAGRLSVSVILLALAQLTNTEQALDWPVLSRILLLCAIGGLLATLVLTAISIRLPKLRAKFE